MTRAVEDLLAGEAEALTRRAVELALTGDVTALRLCLERIAPPRRDRTVTVDLPPLTRPEDAIGATAAIVQAVSAGDLTPAEGQDLAGLVAVHVKAVELHDLEQRIARLEERTTR